MKITTKSGLLYPLILLCALAALLISNTVRPGADAVSHEDFHRNVFILDTPTGLSSQTTYSVIKDHQGFVWVSTRNGIDFYDGEKFEHYRVGESKMRGIRDGMMISLYCDDEGCIWAFTERSIVYCYDKKLDAFVEIVNLPKCGIWGSAQALFRSGDTLFIGSTDGVTCFDLVQDKVIKRICPDDNIRALCYYKEGQLLYGSIRGIGILNLDELRGKLTDWIDTPINHLYYDQNTQRLWVGGLGSGLYLLDPEHPEQRQFVEETAGFVIQQVCPYGNSMLVGMDGAGLWQAKTDESDYINSFTLLASDTPDAPHQIKSSSIRSVLADGENIWVAMYIGGIAHMLPPTSLIHLKNTHAQSTSDLFAQGVNTDARGNIWVAFEQAIGCFDADGSNARYFLDHEAHFLTVLPANDGTVWCGGYNSGLYHFNPNTGWKEHFSSVADLPVNDCIYTIKEASNGDIWVGGLNFALTCLHRLPDNTYQKTNYEEVKLVTDMDWLTPDTLVVATTNGLALVNTSNGQVNIMLKDNDDWTATNYISSIETRNGHEIWGATQGAGIVYIDINDPAHPKRFDMDHSLPSLELRSLELLNDSVLYVSTESNGIFAFDCNNQRYLNSLHTGDGLLSTLFLQASSTPTQDGRVIFGGDQGAVVIQASDLLNEARSFDIIVVGHGVEDDQVSLPYDARNLDIQFTTNDIYHQHEYNFYYRIYGLMDEWQAIDKSRHVRFAQLPAGEYRIDVRAVGAANQSAGKSITILVEKEPWLRWYAILGYVLFTVLLTMGAMMLFGWRVVRKK